MWRRDVGAAIGLFVAIYCAIASLLVEGFHDIVYLGLTRKRPTEDFPVLEDRYRTKYLLVPIPTAVG